MQNLTENISLGKKKEGKIIKFLYKFCPYKHLLLFTIQQLKKF